MATTIKTGWLNNESGDKFAPKTLTSQVQTNDGVLLEDKIQQDIEDAVKNINIPEVDLTDYAKKSEIPSVVGLATEGYVDDKVAELVNSAPEALNTLGELATALENHEDAYDALLEVVGNKSESDHNHDGVYDPAGAAEEVKEELFDTLSNYSKTSEVSTMINNLGIEKGSKNYSFQSKSNESEANQYRKTMAAGDTSVALGRFSRALGDYTYTIGLGTETIAPDKTNGKLQRNQVVVGAYNVPVDGELTSGGTDGARFVVGIGTTHSKRKNGLVVWGDGRVSANESYVPVNQEDLTNKQYVDTSNASLLQDAHSYTDEKVASAAAIKITTWEEDD